MAKTKNIENQCLWKDIASGNNKHDGRLGKCDSSCNGHNPSCEYYITFTELEEAREIYEIPDNSALAKTFEQNHPHLYHWLNTGLGRTYSRGMLA